VHQQQQQPSQEINKPKLQNFNLQQNVSQSSFGDSEKNGKWQVLSDAKSVTSTPTVNASFSFSNANSPLPPTQTAANNNNIILNVKATTTQKNLFPSLNLTEGAATHKQEETTTDPSPAVVSKMPVKTVPSFSFNIATNNKPAVAKIVNNDSPKNYQKPNEPPMNERTTTTLAEPPKDKAQTVNKNESTQSLFNLGKPGLGGGGGGAASLFGSGASIASSSSTNSSQNSTGFSFNFASVPAAQKSSNFSFVNGAPTTATATATPDPNFIAKSELVAPKPIKEVVKESTNSEQQTPEAFKTDSGNPERRGSHRKKEDTNGPNSLQAEAHSLERKNEVWISNSCKAKKDIA
jgi:hypothetical protein